MARFVLCASIIASLLASCSESTNRSRSDVPQGQLDGGGLGAAGSATDPKIQSLRERILPIRSLESTDEDTSDLERIIPLIENARIVFLGEQTHGEASTFEAKTRIVKFLHRRLGFRVLAFEGGMYDAAKIWSNIRRGAPAQSEALNSLFYMYAESLAMRPLFKYIDDNAPTDHPLILSAIYGKHSGLKSQTEMLADLENFASSGALSFHREARWQTFKRLSDGLMKLSGERPSPTDESDFFALAQKAEIELASLPNANPSQRTELLSPTFWRQIVRGLRTHAVEAWQTPEAQVYDVRDAQAADNLLWYAENWYPNDKIIVWAHNGHVARSFEQMSSHDPGEEAYLRNTVPVGGRVSKVLSDPIYVLAFLGYQGAFSDFAANEQYVVEPAAEGSLEALLAAAGIQHGILDLKASAPNTAWLRERQTVRLGEYVPSFGLVHTSVDGVFFIHTVTAATRE